MHSTYWPMDPSTQLLWMWDIFLLCVGGFVVFVLGAIIVVEVVRALVIRADRSRRPLAPGRRR